MTDAVQVEGLELGGVDNVANRYLCRGLRENVSATSPARAGNDAGPPQPEQNLLDVVGRKPLLPGDLAAVDRTQVAALGQVERAYHAVLGPSRYSHDFRIGIRCGGNKGYPPPTLPCFPPGTP